MAPFDPDLQPGISRSLAARRAAAVHGVSCDLALDLPAETDAPVVGRVTIGCTLGDASRPLVVDFAPGLDEVSSIVVNGRPCSPSGLGGHLVIPAGDLEEGENAVSVAFRAGRALHRSNTLIYSLFVPAGAHRVFPCFDQPDLKTRFTLTLTTPHDWQVLSNAQAVERTTDGPRARVRFAETPPLPTYAFAFAAGLLGMDAGPGGRVAGLYHREPDAARLARNRQAIFDLHTRAIAWLEAYTGVPYPFGKLDVLLVPSFEFRGMEHAGAIFYDADAVLLDETPTEDQVLGRAQLIAHETAHMWFGNLVTMRWFDDVWLKEVFANLLAARMVEPAFPDVNHDLRFSVVHYPAAYAVERTPGSHPIRQPLDNLARAKDLYGAIIYHKAPIVMRALERQIGASRLQDALGRHLRNHAYGNAAWDDLRADLEAVSGIDLQAWSRQWIEEPGRTTVKLTAPPTGISPALLEATLSSGGHPPYAHWILDDDARACLLERLPAFGDPVARATGWMALWDEMLEGRLAASRFVDAVLAALPRETVEQVVQLVLTYLREAFWRFHSTAARTKIAVPTERMLAVRVATSPTASMRTVCFSALRSVATSPEAVELLVRIWRGEETMPGILLPEHEQTALAAELAVREVPDAGDILGEQLGRITQPDRRERFAFVMPSLAPDIAVRQAFFESLLDPRGWRRQPWVIEAAGYLSHPLRTESAVILLPQALDLLEPIRENGDIFFAKGWAAAVLSGHRSAAAAGIVRRFLEGRPDYPLPLTRIVLQSADNLFRAAAVTVD
jgi:aminopeptidase N